MARKTRNLDLLARLQNGDRPPLPLTQVAVNVFHNDGGFIDQNPDGQRQSTKRHNVDGLPRPPKGHDGSEQCKGDGGDDNQRAAPVPQEQQDHEAREHAPSKPSRTTDSRSFGHTKTGQIRSRILISGGTAAWNCARLAFTSFTTLRVEASARLVTGM